MTRDMTKGNPLQLILLFSIPMLIGNLFQQLYNMADAFIVGRIIGMDALAAVGSTGGIAFLILGFAFGATSGMSIITAQRYGAHNMDAVRRSFVAGLALTTLVSAVLTVLGVCFSRAILLFLNTPANILEPAYKYLVVITAGISATMFFNLVSGFLRAVGNSRTPLYFLIFACVLNILLDFLFISTFGMGVEGAGYATVIAQLVSGLLCLIVILRRGSPFRLQKKDFRLTKQDLREHAHVALPMGFQSSIIAIGALALQYALNGLGTDAVAAFTAAGKIETIATLPLMSFGATMATYSAQNFGAGHMDRIEKGVKQCIGIATIYSAAMGILCLLAGGRIAAAFLGESGVVASLAHTYLSIYGVSYWALGLLFIYRYTLQGLGYSLVPTIAGVMELLMRTLAAFLLAANIGFAGACLASPLAWVGALLPLSVAYYAIMRKLRRGGQDASPLVPAPAIEAPHSDTISQ